MHCQAPCANLNLGSAIAPSSQYASASASSSYLRRTERLPVGWCVQPCARRVPANRQSIRAASGADDTDASSPLQYELKMIQAAQDSTLNRWKDMYQQQAQDAMAVGLPQSAAPQLPEKPTQADISQAAEKLRRILQSFESAAL